MHTFKMVGLIACIAGAVLLAAALIMTRRWSRRDRIDHPAKSVGTVIGGSAINYCNHHTARVVYEVDGCQYEVDGPLFEFGSTGSLETSNLSDRAHLPKRLVAKNLIFPGIEWRTQSNDRLYAYSAIAKLYPIGSQADVWYDPSEPARAYVERPVRRGVIPTIMLAGWGAALLIVGMIFYAVF